MSAKDRQSRDQKRKAKLANRSLRRSTAELSPYSGKKYQADYWVPHVYQTELAIYEAIVCSGRRLSNEQVRAALLRLLKYLGSGRPALLAEDEPEVPFTVGNEVEFLIWNIRHHWGILFQEKGPVSDDDLAGILRTLLYSIKAHAWHTGPNRGYVAFLDGFMQRGL